MSVEDWARREAASRMNIAPDMTHAEASEFSWGVVHAFSALLSDEAVEAAIDQLDRNGHYIPPKEFVLALQAAINAVTEGDTE